MSVVSKLFKSVKQAFKEVKFFPLRGINVFGSNPFQFEFDRVAAVLKGYGENPYVFAVINRIAERAVKIPFRIVDEEGEEVTTPNPFFTSVMKQPNSEGKRETMYRLFANFLANEVFIVETNALGFDGMTGFIVPNSQDVYINTDSFGNVLSYDYSYLENTTLTVSPDKVLHIKRPDITTQLHNGRSNLIAGAKVYQSNNEIWSSEAALHKNKGITGVLYSDGNRPLTSKEQKELQEQYDKENTGSINFGKVKVSTNKLGYIQMGMNPNDLKSIDTKIEHLRTICALYNVDPRLFGDSAASTYNNMPMAKLGLITDAVLPMLDKVMNDLIIWVSGKFKEEYYYAADVDEIPEMQTAKDELSARLGREVMQGIISSNEAKEILYPHLAVEDDSEGTKSEGDTLDGNSQAEDANAQAQANLRGSVGGVQGILDIQSSVQQGITPRDSAIAILLEIYGFTEEVANDILG